MYGTTFSCDWTKDNRRNVMENELQQTDHIRLNAHFLAFVTIFIWGTTFISTKKLLIDFTPTEILFFRFILVYLALLIAKPVRNPYNSPKEELLFAGAGLCGVTLY